MEYVYWTKSDPTVLTGRLSLGSSLSVLERSYHIKRYYEQEAAHTHTNYMMIEMLYWKPYRLRTVWNDWTTDDERVTIDGYITTSCRSLKSFR